MKNGEWPKICLFELVIQLDLKLSSSRSYVIRNYKKDEIHVVNGHLILIMKDTRVYPILNIGVSSRGA